jgi:hypothetical protein
MNSRAMGIAQQEPQHKLKRMLVKHGSGAVSGHGVANAKILRNKHTTVSQDEGPTVRLEYCEEGFGRQAEGKRYERRTDPHPRWLILQIEIACVTCKIIHLRFGILVGQIQVEVLCAIISRYH